MNIWFMRIVNKLKPMIAEGDALLCLPGKVLVGGMTLASSLFFFVGDDFDWRI
jgi:hypothetical protein